MNKPLEDSIVVWEHHLRQEHPDNIFLGNNNCPLCKVYLDQGHINKCLQCPVQKKIGVFGCKGTPYEGAAVAWMDWGCYPYNQVLREVWRTECSREIEFLKSLKDIPTHDKNDDAA